MVGIFLEEFFGGFFGRIGFDLKMTVKSYVIIFFFQFFGTILDLPANPQSLSREGKIGFAD